MRALLLVALATVGCVSPVARLRTSNVTVPVLLGPVKVLGGRAEPRGPKRAQVAADVESSEFVSGDSTFRVRITKREPMNKIDASVLRALGSCQQCIVHVDRVYFGGWYYVLLVETGMKSWAGVEGSVHDRRGEP